MTKTWQLYLVRHAIAAERGGEWADDSQRPLTARGSARFKEAVKGLKWRADGLDHVFTSPLVRAKQTADLLAQGALVKGKVDTLPSLAPGHAPATVLAALAKAAKPGGIALVGHQPELGELAAHLIGAGHALEFKKGGVCRIDIERLSSPGAGRLMWFLGPRALRRLGR
jgi:phosphohistidine phosphatase